MPRDRGDFTNGDFIATKRRGDVREYDAFHALRSHPSDALKPHPKLNHAIHEVISPGQKELEQHPNSACLCAAVTLSLALLAGPRESTEVTDVC